MHPKQLISEAHARAQAGYRVAEAEIAIMVIVAARAY